MRKHNEVLDKIKGGLIVSCQALMTEPLYSSYIMGRMSYAAMLGGAVGIRANTPKDIMEIKKTVDLPVIGLYKQEIEGYNVFITPTYQAVDELVKCDVEIIAMDATCRLRPYDIPLDEFFQAIRKKYPDQLFMADCASYEDAIHAQEIGFDMVGTTLCSYTDYTKDIKIPCYELLTRLSKDLKVPVLAEGGIWSPEELKHVFDCGIHAAVVGTAITRPMDITRRFVEAIKK